MDHTDLARWERQRGRAKSSERKAIVFCFINTLAGQTREEALMNLAADAKSYGWDTLTVRRCALRIRTLPVDANGVLL